MLLLKKNELNILIEYIFYTFIFLLPWQTRYIIESGNLNGTWEYGTYSLYAIDILLIFIFLLSFFYKKNKLNNKIKISVFQILIAIFLLINFLSLYWALNQELAFYYWLRLLAIIIFIYLIFKINLNFKKIAAVLIGAGFLQSCLAIWQFASQKVVACKWLGISEQLPENLGVVVVENINGRWLRAYGGLPHPNILAGFLVVCILLNIYLYLEIKNKITKIILLINFIILNTALFFSFSRSAYLGLIFALMFLFVFIFIKQKKYKLNFTKFLIILILIYLPLTIIYKDLIFNRFNQANRLEKQSIEQRFNLQEQSFVLIKNYWPTGIGVGNYTQAVHDKINTDLKNYSYQPVHNIYLLIFSEIGVFGLLIFLLILFYSLQKQNFKNNKFLFLSSTLISLLVIGLFDHWLMTLNFGSLLLWLNISFINK